MLKTVAGLSGGKIAVGGGVIGMIVLLLNLFGGENAKNAHTGFRDNTQDKANSLLLQNKWSLLPEQKELGDFASTVFADTEDVWHKVFEENGMTYEEPKMVLFYRSGTNGLWRC